MPRKHFKCGQISQNARNWCLCQISIPMSELASEYAIAGWHKQHVLTDLFNKSTSEICFIHNISKVIILAREISTPILPHNLHLRCYRFSCLSVSFLVLLVICGWSHVYRALKEILDV